MEKKTLRQFMPANESYIVHNNRSNQTEFMNKPSTNKTMKLRSNYIYENTIKKYQRYRIPFNSLIYEYQSVNSKQASIIIIYIINAFVVV